MVSTHHALLGVSDGKGTASAGAVWIRDVGSNNGTFVNRKIVLLPLPPLLLALLLVLFLVLVLVLLLLLLLLYSSSLLIFFLFLCLLSQIYSGVCGRLGQVCGCPSRSKNRTQCCSSRATKSRLARPS